MSFFDDLQRICIIFNCKKMCIRDSYYHMETDAETICNLTNHSYFNLDGHGAPTAMEHEVMINAKRFSPTDQYSIPTGELALVEGTPMDFTSRKPICRDLAADYDQLTMAHGYDHNWVLDLSLIHI